MTAYTTNGHGPISPPDTEVRLTCHYCCEEISADVSDRHLDACSGCRPYAAMSHDALVDTARDQAGYIAHLVESRERGEA